MTIKQKLEKLKTELSATGIPVAYRAFKTEPEKPYICYYSVGWNNFAADGVVYDQAVDVAIELYTSKKDTTTESTVESALASYFFTKSEYFIESEDIYELVYEISL